MAAVAAAAVLAGPYLALDVDTSRTAVRNDLHWVLLVGHIFTAAIALVLGPAQFLPRLRARPRVHRGIGRTYLLAGVLPSGLTGIPVAIMSTNGPVTQLGLLLPAIGWLVTGVLAVRAARGRDFAAHRAWMMRNYALTFLAVTSRLVTPLLLIAQLPLMSLLHDGSFDAAVSATVPIGQWLGWIINLLIAERLLRRTRSRVSVSANAVATG